MATSAQLLLSALSKQAHGAPSDRACDNRARTSRAAHHRTPIPPQLSAPPVTRLPARPASTSAAQYYAPPLTSEPPLANAAPLTSEPPLADAAPLTSEPTSRGTADGLEFPPT
ncbi:hypothetical protein I3F58_16780 [Streptomyces sp. MUM 203J]|uniref:hypothetical protein n=1 Tax=Streptomyces sp. MUM 203J TaxID=2791990 RepID=UPI001F04C9F5|nr:hypothetical protein [Streptomyces sp. MUM 203J]MCH0541191.1 hypothetical protein [Streptomyces sp. MUM 203J]